MATGSQRDRVARVMNDRRGYHVDELDEPTRDDLLDAIIAAAQPTHPSLLDDPTDPPIAIDELVRWCAENRADFVEPLKQIAAATGLPGPVGQRAQVQMLTIALAFTAGRAYQASPKHATAALPQIKDPYL